MSDPRKPMHWLIIGPLSVKTGCGIKISCLYPQYETVLDMDDTKLNATVDSSKVTGAPLACEKCKSAIATFV